MTDQDRRNHHVYVSECCEASYERLAEVHIVQTARWCTSYYHVSCSRCGKPCHTKLWRAFDSAGNEILPGHLVEVPELPDWHAERWNAAYIYDYGSPCLEIRDLGNNNRNMYSCYAEYFTRGPYWNHLDKVSDEDLEYYWDTTRTEAEEKLREERLLRPGPAS